MSNPNPYYDPEEDEDILSPKQSSSPKPGASSFVDGGNFSILGPDGKELPPELRDALARYININDLDKRAVTLPPGFDVVTGMMDFYSTLNEFRRDGVMLGALAEVVDEATSGRLKITHDKFKAERTIIYTKIVASFGSGLGNMLDNLPAENKEEICSYIESILEINDFLYEQAVDLYVAKCIELDKEPDASLIESGLYANRDYIRRLAFAEPPALEDDGRD